LDVRLHRRARLGIPRFCEHWVDTPPTAAPVLAISRCDVPHGVVVPLALLVSGTGGRSGGFCGLRDDCGLAAGMSAFRLGMRRGLGAQGRVVAERFDDRCVELRAGVMFEFF
jgi:hypothetical protein